MSFQDMLRGMPGGGGDLPGTPDRPGSDQPQPGQGDQLSQWIAMILQMLSQGGGQPGGGPPDVGGGVSPIGPGAASALDPQTLMMLEAMLGGGGGGPSPRATSPLPGDLPGVAQQMASAPPTRASIPRQMRNY